MDFEVPEEVRQISRMVDDFLEQEIEPLEREYSHFVGEDAEMNIIEGSGSDYYMCEEYVDLWAEIRKLSAEAGIWTMHMPEDVGGGGLDVLPFTMVIEHLENRNPHGLHHLIWNTGTVTEMMIPAYHDDFQREKYFEPMMSGDALAAFALTEPNHGSDATWMDSSAEREGDEWVIDGEKTFVSKGNVCDYIMMNARTSGEDGDISGITTFLVDADNPGVEVTKVQRLMGDQPGRLATLSFDDCRVPERQVLGEVDEGFEQLIGWIGAGRLTIAAEAVGRSQWMLEQSVQYGKDRTTFGEPIGKNQGIQFQLADLAADVEQVRWLYRYAAWRVDEGKRVVKEQSIAKLRGAELWNHAADAAIQVHGGSGYTRSLPFESEYRDARAARIYEGTDEILRRTISKELL